MQFDLNVEWEKQLRFWRSDNPAAFQQIMQEDIVFVCCDGKLWTSRKQQKILFPSPEKGRIF